MMLLSQLGQKLVQK